MPEHLLRGTVTRSRIELAFAGRKHRVGLIISSAGINRAKAKIGLTSLNYNIQCLVWLQAESTPN